MWYDNTKGFGFDSQSSRGELNITLLHFENFPVATWLTATEDMRYNWPRPFVIHDWSPFVSDLLQVGGWFPETDCHDIGESGIKHHKTNPFCPFSFGNCVVCPSGNLFGIFKPFLHHFVTDLWRKICSFPGHSCFHPKIKMFGWNVVKSSVKLTKSVNFIKNIDVYVRG